MVRLQETRFGVIHQQLTMKVNLKVVTVAAAVLRNDLDATLCVHTMTTPCSRLVNWKVMIVVGKLLLEA